MDIQYLGHSSFKLKGKAGSVVTDPYPASVGFKLPSVSADIVTVSHTQHDDHDNVLAVSGTARRKDPFVITEPGEYEVDGISVFGYQTYHDSNKGEDRGTNTVYVIQIEGVRILHLGDLGHTLSEKLVNTLDSVDVVLVPVGGEYTIDSNQALVTIDAIDPHIAIPMHYKTSKHDEKVFGSLDTLDGFLKVYEGEVKRLSKDDKLSVSRLSLGEDSSTEIVVFD